MLLEEQVAELLRRCEEACGQTLRQVRGNLRVAETRASAVWELLVIEAASRVGNVAYEPLDGASPDIRLMLGSSEPLWMEAAYLYPRFWKEERLSREVERWIWEECRRLGISVSKVSPRLDGVPRGHAGPVRILPGAHERAAFLAQPELGDFFRQVTQHPELPRTVTLSAYTVSITYSPTAPGPFSTSGGLVQEAPTSVAEHAAYRTLREKARRYSVAGPLVVCLGSDQSPALSGIRGPGVVSTRQAIQTAFAKYSSVSAVMVTAIENVPELFVGYRKRARVDLFVNERARHPLQPDHITAVRKLDFNRWQFSYALDKWEHKPAHRRNRVTGQIRWSPRPMRLEIEIPTNVLIDALAGKTSVAQAFRFDRENQVARAFEEGWEIASCSLVAGDIEAGEAPKVRLELVPPSPGPYWPKRP